MSSKKNIPAIRFRGFDGEWETKFNKDVCSISTGKSNTQDKIEDGLYPFFVRSSVVERSNKYLFDEEAVLTAGDGVGTGKVFHYFEGKYDLHQRVYRMYNFDGIVGRYFYYYFANHFYDRVMAMTAKSSVDSVRLEMISEMEIDLPHSISEQNKISTLLSVIDHLITQSTKRLEKLKNLKKAYLEKMFPRGGATTPELRFKGFSDEWERTSLNSSEFNIIAGGDVDKNSLHSDGEYPVIANALVGDGIVGYYKNSFRITAPAVTVTGRGDVGVAKARKVNFTPIVRLLVITSPYDVDFLENAINLHKVCIESTGVPQLTVPQIRGYEIYLPKNIDEQKKIGNFFRNIDEQIAKQTEKLDKLKNIKKACLDKMFV